MNDPALRLVPPPAADGKTGHRPLITIPGHELYNLPTRKENYLVDKLIGTGAKFALSGTRGELKSWTMVHLAICVAARLPFVNKFPVTTRDTRAGAVLFVQLEEKPWQAQRKYQWVLNGMGITDPAAIQDLLVEWVVGQPFKIGAPGRMDELKFLIERLSPDLVLWDSLLRMHDGKASEGEYAERLVYMLDQLQEVWPSAHGFSAHYRKKSADKALNDPNERVRDSSAIVDQVDAHIAMERNRLNDFVTLNPVKNRDGEEHSAFNVRWRIVDHIGSAYPEYLGVAVDMSDGTDARAAILGALADGELHTIKAMEETLKDFSMRQLRYAAKSLETDRLVFVYGGGGRPMSLKLRIDQIGQ